MQVALAAVGGRGTSIRAAHRNGVLEIVAAQETRRSADSGGDLVETEIVAAARYVTIEGSDGGFSEPMTTTNYLKTALLLGCADRPDRRGRSGYLIGGKTGMIVALGPRPRRSTWARTGSRTRLVLGTLQGAEPVMPVQEAPRLHAMVDGLVARAGLPKPALYILPEPFTRAPSPQDGIPSTPPWRSPPDCSST